MVMRPLMKKILNIHEAISFSDSPPLEPTARMMATGAVTAYSQPMKAFDRYRKPKSERICRRPGGRPAGRSIWDNMETKFVFTCGHRRSPPTAKHIRAH